MATNDIPENDSVQEEHSFGYSTSSALTIGMERIKLQAPIHYVNNPEDAELEYRVMDPRESDQLRKLQKEWYPFEYPNRFFELIESRETTCLIASVDKKKNRSNFLMDTPIASIPSSLIAGAICFTNSLKSLAPYEEVIKLLQKYLLNYVTPQELEIPRQDNRHPYIFYISSLGVAETFRGLGLGRKLLSKAIEHIRLKIYGNNPTDIPPTRENEIGETTRADIAELNPISLPTVEEDGGNQNKRHELKSGYRSIQLPSFFCLFLHVITYNITAIDFYTKNNFSRIAVNRNYYRIENTLHDALILARYEPLNSTETCSTNNGNHIRHHRNPFLANPWNWLNPLKDWFNTNYQHSCCSESDLQQDPSDWLHDSECGTDENVNSSIDNQ